MKAINSHVWSRCWVTAALALAAALAAQAQTYVTFSVDMNAYGTPGAVYVNGSFNGWGTPGSPVLVNNGSDVWTNTLTITDPPGTVEQFKFWNDTYAGNWESLNNRQFVLGAAGSTQVLTPQLFNTNTLPVPTNYVTFQVDMSAQVALGNFTPSGTITVSGDFEGWDNGLPLTNNSSLSGNASNVYSAVCPVQFFPPSEVINYKFRMNGGWESPASTSGNNRTSTVTPNEVLPLVYYNDNSIYDLVLTPITVTFTLYMTNGTVDDDGYAYNNQSDTLWINADFLNNWNNDNWPGPIGSFPAAQQMIEVGTSDYYTNSFVVPRGNSVYINYKYAIDSKDDENGFATNHVREVRSYGPTYAMPTDSWSWNVVQPNVAPYPNPGLSVTNIVEPDFGYLAIQSPSGGAYPITWLGRPGVILQNTTNLTGTWNVNSGTDATQATNWPSAGSGSQQFFRLQKEQ